ncbi:MAG: cytochrome c biogenesis protein CcdA [Planctomycetota bacterium]
MKPTLFPAWILLIVAFGLLFAPAAHAQSLTFDDEFDLFEGSDDEPLVVTSWFRMKEGTRLGNIYIHATIGETYHTYSQNHGGVENKTTFDVPESDQFSLLGQFVPDVEPHKFEKDGYPYEEFEHEVTWSAPFEIAEGVDAESLLINVTHRGQVCDANSCQPPVTNRMEAAFDGWHADLEVDAEEGAPVIILTPQEEVESAAPLDTPEVLAELAALYDVESKIQYVKLDGSTGVGTLWTAMLGAFLGGMILNLMPCVFPVLGLKVLGFVEQAGNDPKKIRLHGIAFAMGLLASMWVLAGVILGIKFASGEEVNWGQQMGNPYFVGGIVILLFVLGLNLAGVFEMGLFMTRAGSGDKKEGYTGSFVSGIITTLVATPCSGPFLGAAMGYTLAQPAYIAMFLFTIFGLGIAFPYLVLSFAPKLIGFLPKPGPWMETFKKLMAFTLFAAAVFFARTFGALTGLDGLSLFLMAMCVVSLAAFFYGKFSPAYIQGNKRYVWGWAAPFLIAGAGIWMFVTAAQYQAPKLLSEDGWTPWVPGRVEQKLAENKPVWVDYTADW